MFKLPHPPSPKAEIHELADFVEIIAWDKKIASARDALAYLGRIDDNNDNLGIDDDDNANEEILDEVMNEIERRATACGGGYPFDLDTEGTVLRHNFKRKDYKPELYRYLLLSTRLDMENSRAHAKIDGTLLFEEIVAEVLKHYLGGSKAQSIVFGTAVTSKFQEKVTQMCKALGEGGRFRHLDSGHVRANDDKLDAVAWVPFSDKLPGQLIAFAQCKTGTSWRDSLGSLNPDAFIRKWVEQPFLVNPIRAFCIAESENRARWKGTCIEGGILFDRCRIVDFCQNLETDLLAKVRLWTNAAKQTVNPIIG